MSSQQHQPQRRSGTTRNKTAAEISRSLTDALRVRRPLPAIVRILEGQQQQQQQQEKQQPPKEGGIPIDITRFSLLQENARLREHVKALQRQLVSNGLDPVVAAAPASARRSGGSSAAIGDSPAWEVLYRPAEEVNPYTEWRSNRARRARFDPHRGGGIVSPLLPEGGRWGVRRPYLPVHRAIYYDCDPDVVLYLAGKTTRTDWIAESPLYLLLRKIQLAAEKRAADEDGDGGSTVAAARRSYGSVNDDAQLPLPVLLALLAEMCELYKSSLTRPMIPGWCPALHSHAPEGWMPPLHFAVANRLPLPAVRIIARADPAAARVQAPGNNAPTAPRQYPFEAACRRYLSLGDVGEGGEARGGDKEDELFQLVKLLIDLHPGAVSAEREKETHFLRNLFVASRRIFRVREPIRQIMETMFPSLKDEWLPIHFAIKAHLHRSPLFQQETYIIWLIQLFPECIPGRDRDGMNALHWMAIWINRFACCFLLAIKTSSGPEAARAQDNNSATPLHYICKANPPGLVYVKALVEAAAASYPSSDSLGSDAVFRVRDRTLGELPLHAACRTWRTRKRPGGNMLLRYLIVCDGPRAPSLRVKNKDGLLPLHCALASTGTGGCLSVDDVRYFVERYPESVKTKSNFALVADNEKGEGDGEVPSGRSSRRPGHYLLQLYPVSLAALSDSCGVDVVYYMLREYPEAILIPPPATATASTKTL